MTDLNWIMKVLSGANVGAEVPLLAEDLVLGKDEDCDIVIDDVMLADRQLTLRLEDEGVALTVLAERPPLSIDGAAIEGRSVVLSEYQLVAIGTVRFAVGPATGDWSAVDLSPGDKAASDAAGEEEAEVEEDSGDEPAETDEDRGDEDAAPVAEAPAPPRSRAAPWLAAAAGLVLVGAALLFWLGAFTEPVEPGATASRNPDIIEAIAQKYDAEIEISEPAGDGAGIEVVGFIATAENYRNFVSDIEALRSGVALSITLGETLLAAAQSLIDEALDRHSRVDVALVPEDPGVLHFSGYVHDAGALDKLKTLTKTDLKGQKGATFDIETRQERVRELAGLLGDAGIGMQVDIEVTVDGIDFYSPAPDAALDQALADVKDRFHTRYAGLPPIVWNPEQDFSGRTSIALDVKSVGLGDPPHVVMEGGFRYEPGQVLDNGYQLKAVTANYILMRKGADSAYYFFD